MQVYPTQEEMLLNWKMVTDSSIFHLGYKGGNWYEWRSCREYENVGCWDKLGRWIEPYEYPKKIKDVVAEFILEQIIGQAMEDEGNRYLRLKNELLGVLGEPGERLWRSVVPPRW